MILGSLGSLEGPSGALLGLFWGRMEALWAVWGVASTLDFGPIGGAGPYIFII